MTSQEESRKLREEGNALYKIGNLLQAIPKYRQAAKIAPQDPAPLGNISAAIFEIGKYESCISFAERALALHKKNVDCDVVSSMAQMGQVKKLEARLQKAKMLVKNVGEVEEKKTRMRILNEVGRYRPTVNSGYEYFHVGHDQAFCMYESSSDKYLTQWAAEAREEEQRKSQDSGVPFDEKAAAKRELISFLFVGVGDARNMLRTIIGIAGLEHTRTKKYHITINDINKTALTRDLIIFMLLEDLSQLDPKSEEYTEVMTTVYFIYIAVMMPRFVFDRMQQTIGKALVALKSGNQPSKVFRLNKQHFPEYIKVLTSWEGSAQTLIPAKKVIQMGTRQVSGLADMVDGTLQLTLKCKAERELYLASLILQPPTQLLEKHDPTMLELLQKYQSRPRANAPRFRDHLCKHWEINTTLMDEDWYRDLQNKEHLDFGHDPYEATERFTDEVLVVGKNPEKLYDYMLPFFSEMANALVVLEGRLTVEVILGDCVDVAEQLRFALFPTSGESKGENGEVSNFEVRPEHYPNSFNRIHLSNVPDYLNGNLSTCLHFAPILADAPISMLFSTCLRNSGSWKSVNSFLAEYQCITDEKQLFQLTNVSVVDKEEETAMYGPYTHSMPMASYVTYSYMGYKPQPFSRLLQKKGFMKWIYALFFRMALPFNIDLSFVPGMVFSPLNITTFFHLLVQLRKLGYPSHWLSEALTNILENKVITTCRPPRASPTSIQAIKRDHPEKKLSTKPFSSELSVLAKIFQPLVPFQLTTPLASSIRKYTFKMTASAISTYDSDSGSAHLILIFWSPEYLRFSGFAGGQAHAQNIRQLLDPSWGEVDTDFANKDHERFREKGCVVYSAFELEKRSDSLAVKCWMDGKTVGEMKEGGWCWGLFRVDIWAPAFTRQCAVGETVFEGKTWE